MVYIGTAGEGKRDVMAQGASYGVLCGTPNSSEVVRMDPMHPLLLVSAALALAAILGIGVLSGKKVRNSDDFDTGGNRAGPLLVAGTIVGTLVGGSSTIGTAQLAFLNGLSAWWFTLGASVGCVLLAAVSGPLRSARGATIQEIIAREYGATAGVATSILASAGFILNIMAQILAANALLETLFGLGPAARSAVGAALMAAYVLFGGIRGAGILGIVKMALIYLAVAVAGTAALRLSGGIGFFLRELPRERYFNLLARGAGVDLGAGLSVALGVLSTQTYIQAALVARSDRAARHGALLSALIIPPVGILSICVGWHMRIRFPSLPAGQAFPRFVLEYLPPAWAGLFLATLLIAIIGTGSGMALGFGRILTNDLYRRYMNPRADGKRLLRATRIVILAALAASALFTLGNVGKTILTFGFLSMGLRAAVLLVPLLTALYLPGWIRSGWAVASSVSGLTAMLVGKGAGVPFDPLLIGIAAGAATAGLGFIAGRRRGKA